MIILQLIVLWNIVISYLSMIWVFAVAIVTLGAYYMSGIMRITLQASFSLNFPHSLGGRETFYYPHFTEEQTEAQRCHNCFLILKPESERSSSTDYLGAVVPALVLPGPSRPFLPHCLAKVILPINFIVTHLNKILASALATISMPSQVGSGDIFSTH